jgi:succinate dehydrogenase/fumarate reductase flavoprotein subunit
MRPGPFREAARFVAERAEQAGALPVDEAYDPVRKEAATRDVSARGIFDQIRFGKAVDGGVVLDVSAVPDEVFRHENSKVVERLDPHGIDYRTIPLIIAPEAHFVMGGVLIDEWGGSSRPGLYACGETAGGVHGGNRLNSNAVPETQVFGHRAGQAAARHAGTAAPGAVDDGSLRRWTRRLAEIRTTAQVSPAQGGADAFRAMWSAWDRPQGAGSARRRRKRPAEEHTGGMRPETLGELVAATDWPPRRRSSGSWRCALRTEPGCSLSRITPTPIPGSRPSPTRAAGLAAPLAVDPGEAARSPPAPPGRQFIE